MFLAFWAKIALFQRKCVFVLGFTEARLKLFLILEKSEARALKKVVLKKKACYIERLNKSGRDKENKIAQGDVNIFSQFPVFPLLQFSFC